MLVKVRTKNAKTQGVLIHVEIEAQRTSEMPRRMWEYYRLIERKHALPVFPIVLHLSPRLGGITTERYREELFGMTVHLFEYVAIGLPDFREEDYMVVDNVLSPAMRTLMKNGEDDRVLRRIDAYERLAKADLDEEGCELLTDVVDQYPPLNSEIYRLGWSLNRRR